MANNRASTTITMGMILNRSFSDIEPTSAARAASPLTPLAVAPMDRATAVTAIRTPGTAAAAAVDSRAAGPQGRLELDGPAVGADVLGRALVVAVGGRGQRRAGSRHRRELGGRPQVGQLLMGGGQLAGRDGHAVGVECARDRREPAAPEQSLLGHGEQLGVAPHRCREPEDHAVGSASADG